MNPEMVAEAIIRGVRPSEIRIRGTDQEVELFNREVSEADVLRSDSSEPVNIDMAWQLPQKYKDLNLREYVFDKFIEVGARLGYANLSEPECDAYADRLDAELAEIERRGMVEFTKTIIFVLDTFREKGILWGVGRGSSCASYVLYILGLHVVDCVKFNVPMEEFFHD
jgi:DNA polymerase III alpha subunit